MNVQSSSYSAFYWSSTTDVPYPSRAWYASLISGIVSPDPKTSAFDLWPVRGGR
ncbi:MAG: hypothetical protein P9F75_11600 [Candidatus Contendobacter sp.]|nr:hypothetical protein [Candidatus Contendobacter sp.]